MGSTQKKKPRGKPFPKGVSGNPAGRPPRQTERQYLDVAMGAVSVRDWEAVVKRALKDAKAGDASARKWLADFLHPRDAADLFRNLLEAL